MNVDGALEMARRGELYPSVILHGGDGADRRRAALTLSRALLCTAPPEERPCGVCTHCRRITLEVPDTSGDGGEVSDTSGTSANSANDAFHPDFAVLERDLKTSTSVDATKAFLKVAHVSPFEARGQAFVVTSAESLTGEAANALLKTLEEPGDGAPRHFLLLAPSQQDLLPTLRSRSLAVYLGAGTAVSREAAAPVAERLGHALASLERTGAPVWLLAVAGILESAGEFRDPRDQKPWALAARALIDTRAHLARMARNDERSGRSRALLALAEDLLAARALRLRGITARRILEGLTAKHLA